MSTSVLGTDSAHVYQRPMLIPRGVGYYESGARGMGSWGTERVPVVFGTSSYIMAIAADVHLDHSQLTIS